MMNLAKYPPNEEAENLEAAVNSIKINRDRVFSVISLTPNSPVFGSVMREYECAEQLFFDNIKLRYSFMLEDNLFFETSNIAFGGVTLGENVSLYISDLFDKSEYLKAIILNAICDDYIMQAAEVLEQHIKLYCERKGLNIVKKIDPYSHVSPEWIKRISDKLTALYLHVNEEFCIEPEKTLLTVFAVDRCKKSNIKFGCIGCSKDCKWRKI